MKFKCLNLFTKSYDYFLQSLNANTRRTSMDTFARLIINSKKIIYLVVISFLLASCANHKKRQRTYKEYENKRTIFSKRKYKFTKKKPPIQRYYARTVLFRPKK